MNNFTVFNSQMRLTRESHAVLQYTGPGNFIVNNLNSSVFYLVSVSAAVVRVNSIAECNPVTNVTKFVNVTNSYITMPENPDLTHNTVLALSPGYGVNTRPAKTFFINNLIERVYMTSIPVVYILNTPINLFYSMNNTFRN